MMKKKVEQKKIREGRQNIIEPIEIVEVKEEELHPTLHNLYF